MTENQNEKKIEPIGERLSKVMKHYGLNKNSLAIKLGLPSNSVITRIVNDKDPERGMGLPLIKNILTTFPEVNPRWFILGGDDKDMFIDMKSSKKVEETNPPQSGCIGCIDKERIIKLLEDKIKGMEGLDREKSPVFG